MKVLFLLFIVLGVSCRQDESNFRKSIGIKETKIDGIGKPTTTTADLYDVAVNISPTTKNFGNVANNSTSTVVFNLTNDSLVTAYLNTASVSGTGFTKTGSTCDGVTLSSGASCSVTVQFSPVTNGFKSGEMKMIYSDTSGNNKQTIVQMVGTGVEPQVAFSFSGFTSSVLDYTDLTPTGATLQWTPQPLASYYKLFRVDGSSLVHIATLLNTATSSYTLNLLNANTTYSYRINAYDATDSSDGNNNLASFTTTNATGATFNGWSDVVALGEVVTDISQVDDNLGLAGADRIDQNLYKPVGAGGQIEPAQVKIAWDAFTITPAGVPEDYLIERSIDNVNFVDITGSGTLNVGARTFIDQTVNEETYYYYRVLPVISNTLPVAAAADRTIRVFVPPKNMGLMHRWIANREFCEKVLGKTWPDDFDRGNHYMCNYTWGKLDATTHAFAPDIPLDQFDAILNPDPTGYGRHKEKWDLGYSLIIDKFEIGCKVTGHAYPDGAVPSGGVDGDVATRKGGGVAWVSYHGPEANSQYRCYRKIAGSWTITNSGVDTNMPGYPPLNLTQNAAVSYCASRNTVETGSMRIWRIEDAVMARAWQGVFRNPSDAQINIYNSGVNLPDHGSCISLSKSGSTGISNANIQVEFISAARLHLTGSNNTRNCQSRYELQDTIGNAREWTTSQVGSCNLANSCEFIPSPFDNNNILADSFAFNGSVGKSWNAVANIDYIDGSKIPFLGLPVATPGNSFLGVSGLGSQGIDSQFQVWKNVINGIVLDAGYQQSSSRGRYTFTGLPQGSVWPLANTTFRESTNGVRCMGEVLP